MSRNTGKGNVSSDESTSKRPMSPLSSSIGSPRSQKTIVPMRFGPPIAVSGNVEVVDKTKGSGSRSSKRQADANNEVSKDGSSVTSPRFGNPNPPLPSASTAGQQLPGDASPTLTLSSLPPDQYVGDNATLITAGVSYLPSPMTEATALPIDYDQIRATRGPYYSTSTPPPRLNGSIQSIPSLKSFTTPGFSTPEGPGSPADGTEIFSEVGTVTDAIPPSSTSVRSVVDTPRSYATVMPAEDMGRFGLDEQGTAAAEVEENVQYRTFYQDSILSADSTYAKQRRSLLDILNRLHSTGVQKDIDLPQIVVIGSQSVGKSSLIESMSGVTLPRDTGTCTRCPLECRLEYSPDKWSCRVFLRFERGSEGEALEQVKEIDFGGIITDKTEVEVRLRRAQRAILRPSLESELFLRDEDLSIKEPPPLSFSSNCVCMRITGPDVPDLYFFDLPGIIANVREGGDPKDIELIRQPVLNYISRPSCLILLVVSCETDFENQGAGRLAFEVDPEGDRIVGVLTKPDRIEHATGDKWAAVLRNEENRLVNGWFCVRQPDPTELRQKTTWEDARVREELFFANHEPWKYMTDRYRRRLGSTNLIRFLSRLLSRLIAIRLPDVERELAIGLEDIERKINQLPPPKYNDPSSELVVLIFEFTSTIARDVKGLTRFDQASRILLHGVRSAQLKFRRSIMRTTPRFCPWERRDTPLGSPSSAMSVSVLSSTGAPVSWVTEPSFLTKEEIASFEDRTSKIMYLDEVMEILQQAITRELPGDYPIFAVKEELIRNSMKGWGKPMLEYFEAVYGLMVQHAKTLVNVHFGLHMHSGLHSTVMRIVREQLRIMSDKTLQRLNSLLSIEGLPFTLNHAQLQEYKDEFLAHYRDIRRRSKGQDTIVQRLQQTEGVVSAQLNNELLDLVELLRQFGLPCKPADLHRLLPEDGLAPALDIIATVRAYFEISFRRFIDIVPLVVDSEFFRSLEGAIRTALVISLDVKSPERCAFWLQDSPEVVSRRKDFLATKQRLEAARMELTSFLLA